MKRKSLLLGATLLMGLGASHSVTAQTNYFTEYFNSGEFDLGGKRLMFEPVGGTNYYDVVALETNITALPYSTAGYGGLVWYYWYEYKSISIPGGRTVQLYGNIYNTLYIHNAGYIRFTDPAGDGWWVGPSLSGHFANPQISTFFASLDPLAGGKVSVFEAYSAGIPIATVVTFEDVPGRYSSALYTFQCVMYYTGYIEMSWLSTSNSDTVIVGLSSGDGYPPDYEETNLSAYFADEPDDPYDLDGDGLLDLWEAFYFGSYTNCNPDGHGDADDFDNKDEYDAGTDPTDSSDYFKVYCSFNGSQSNPGIVLNWTAPAAISLTPPNTNRVYSVWHNGALSASLTNLTSDILYPTNSYTVPMDQVSGFFNVGVRIP